MEEWSNHAALGYAIMAAENMGWSKEQIERLVRGMQVRFDLKTIEEAVDHYCKSPY
ncbi:hypothetical protein ABE237_22565 [Brevibacillus formosus]|uniref:hypothetical protein n=1 Tax=Brevibacillus formosus TaxID=54913 RepID=UPI001F54E483|nr:hypothetical protein [Brevibacillus formosus]